MCPRSGTRTYLTIVHTRTHTVSPTQGDILNYKGVLASGMCQGVFVGDYFSVRD